MSGRAVIPKEQLPLSWETFLDTSPAEADPDRAAAVIIPVPYDGTTSYRTGARYGPSAIVRASKHLEDYDLALDRDISLVGIHTAPAVVPDAGGPERVVEQVYRTVLEWAERGKLVAVLGGEHTIAIGAVRALREVFPDISVLFIDAHADLRDSYMGTRWGHASVARRIGEICPIVEVGVRSMTEEERDFIRATKLPVHRWPSEGDVDALADRVLETLTSHVYVSVDLDALDPSIMAAVGTPEPGGMSWADVTGLLSAIAGRREVVGFDLSELSPGEGPEACAFTAAKLAYRLIGYATALHRHVLE
jgi:agmatinase